VGLPAKPAIQRPSAQSTIGEALLGIFETELEFAAAQLQRYSEDPEKAVHQCRRTIKRLRALLRIGIAVPGARVRPHDRRLRGAARILSPIRDASEAERMLSSVLSSHPELESLKHLEILTKERIDTDVSVKKARAKLQKAQQKFPDFFAARDSWTVAALTTGIEGSYVRAATEFFRFSKKHTDKIGHDWRKEVQCLANQLNIIKPISSEFLARFSTQLKQLAGLLGQHNDLAVLRMRLKARRKKLPKKTHATLKAVVKSDQRRLRRQAIKIGDELFGMSPDDFRGLLLCECTDRAPDQAVLRPTS
jgi:CHAD domain-containing protein